MRRTLVVATIILMLISFVIILLTKPGQRNSGLFPFPTPIGVIEKSSVQEQFRDANPTTVQNLTESYLVGQLQNKLPHNEGVFALYYDINKDEYILVLDKNNVDQGNLAFDKFLNENGIGNRSWIKKLVTTYR